MSVRLEIDNVSWRAGDRAILSAVSLVVRRGEFVALMGLNGAGKSTLLDVVAGLRRPSGGAVRLDGLPVGQWDGRSRARAMAHLPQSVRPDVPFVAGEMVLMGRYPHTDRWFESEADRGAVEGAMRRTGCFDLRGRTMGTLSGGERQRVLLAACLAQAAEILLLDEPSAHLDLDQQLQCFSLLAEERQRGTTILAVTHDLNLALAHATRLVVLADGRVAVDLPVEEAGRSSEWLSLFSSKLTLTSTPSGRPWVAYS